MRLPSGLILLGLLAGTVALVAWLGGAGALGELGRVLSPG